MASLSRRMNVVRARQKELRHKAPAWLPRRYTQLRSMASEYHRWWISVEHRSRFANVYHCCVQKTGSQWLKSQFLDPEIYRWSGLSYYHYHARQGIGDRYSMVDDRYERPVTPRSIVSPVYVTYENYLAMPKNGPHRAFFVMRDPRDLVVSWYFSAARTHIVSPSERGPLAQAREELARLSRKEGLLYGIDYWERRGKFATLASWTAAADDPNVRLVRYEDLIGPDSFQTMRDLFEFLDIGMPDAVLRELLGAYSFERVTGRARGSESQDSHLRKASAGDWVNHFDAEVEARFHEVTDSLLAQLGYDER
jgi:Sulfotransferase domain